MINLPLPPAGEGRGEGAYYLFPLTAASSIMGPSDALPMTMPTIGFSIFLLNVRGPEPATSYNIPSPLTIGEKVQDEGLHKNNILNAL
jgi:hypothetical protein